MNRKRAVPSVLALTVAALAAQAPVVASATAGAAATRTAVCGGEYQGDARLGPQTLPRPQEEPVGPLLEGYKRTGGLSPKDFIATYWKEAGPQGPADWKYPPDDGFAKVKGEVDKQPEVMEAGDELDHFGSEHGTLLSPAGEPFAKRALPPQSLNTRDRAFPCDYHQYTVKRPFLVWQGTAAPWFEQPGGGQRIKLDAALLNPGAGERLTVKWLVDHDYLDPAAR